MAEFEAIINIAVEAGKIILGFYQKEFSQELKIDKSIVTEADKAADNYIVEQLNKLFPHIPVVSEEGPKDRLGSDVFFLVDPLDGTRGFVKGRGEFTVNIGIIENQRAVAGVIYIPVTDEVFFAEDGRAYKNNAQIHARKMPHDGVVALASKYHRDKETLKIIEELKISYPNLTESAAASSLKFCRIAEGVADIYPRFGRTMEWDTAAGQAILQCAGGSVTNPDGSEFLYAKRDDWENGPFIARGKN